MTSAHHLRLGLAGLLLLAGVAQAGGELPVPQGAKVAAESPAQDKDRIYPLGALRKISGQLRMEGRIESRGQLSSTTWELPRELDAQSAFTAAREALQASGGYPLFWCQARDCGENSLWANEIFRNASLSGSDEDQFFILLRRSGADHDTLVALYAITRGNRRAYLHVEQLEANAPLGELLPTPATGRCDSSCVFTARLDRRRAAANRAASSASSKGSGPSAANVGSEAWSPRRTTASRPSRRTSRNTSSLPSSRNHTARS